MNKPGRPWWGYVKSMIERYPEEVNKNELRAVEKAIEKTKQLKDGQERLKVIDLMFWSGGMTLAGAAQMIPCSYETARRWHGDFIREVARNFKCSRLF